MKINGKSVRNSIIVFCVIEIFLVSFYFIAKEQIMYTKHEEIYSGSEEFGYLPELGNNTLSQRIITEDNILDSLKIYFVKGGNGNFKSEISIFDDSKTNVGTVNVSEKDIDKEGWYEANLNNIELPEDNKYLDIYIDTICDEGTSLYIPYTIFQNEPEGKLLVNSIEEKNTGAKLGIVVKNKSIYAEYMVNILIFLTAVVLVYLIKVNINLSNGKKTLSTNFIENCVKYSFLIKQLVSRDFKIKYKKSFLGIGWSLLNPLLTMTVQYFVFSNIFKFSVKFYPVYLLSGIVIYNGFSECTSQAMNAIVGNASLITKVYMPKEIYPITKVLSSFINVLFSFIPLIIVIMIQGLKVNWAYLFIPFLVVMLLLFIIGISMIISAAMVFFRDIQFLWGVFTLMWMYATPIIYPIDILPSIMQKFMAYNPMYHYVTFIRTIIIDGVCPQPESFMICAGYSMIALIVGYISFEKLQKKFIFYL